MADDNVVVQNILPQRVAPIEQRRRHVIADHANQLPQMPQRGRLQRQIAVGVRNDGVQNGNGARQISRTNSEVYQDQNEETRVPISLNPMVRGISYSADELVNNGNRQSSQIDNEMIRSWLNILGQRGGRGR